MGRADGAGGVRGEQAGAAGVGGGIRTAAGARLRAGSRGRRENPTGGTTGRLGKGNGDVGEGRAAAGGAGPRDADDGERGAIFGSGADGAAIRAGIAAVAG